MSFTPEQAKAVKDQIAQAEKNIRDVEEEISRMKKAGLATASLEAEHARVKDALSKIKAVYG